jgi:hypothetical protein
MKKTERTERFVWYYAYDGQCFCENCIENKETRNDLGIFKKNGSFVDRNDNEVFEKKNIVIEEDGVEMMEYLVCENCANELFFEDCTIFF